MIKKDQIPLLIIETVEKLEEAGFEAYLVGGCVRDLILKKDPKDWDITTNARPEQIIKIFDDTFYENKFGTVGVKTESVDPKLKVIEITPYRLETKYSDHRHPDEVIFSQKLEDDLKRRDFTINALAYNINKGQIIDLYKGQEDIKDKIIRTVGNPNDRFTEDALRILRAIRFSAELGFTINTDVINSIVSHETLLKKVSKERIRDEFDKIIMSDNPMIGLVISQKISVLQHVSKNFEVMVGVSQNKEAHLYDVWEHSLRALQHAADKGFSKIVRLSALFHDIGKPKTKRVSGNKTTFFGHEVVGEKISRETLVDLKYNKETIEKVSKMVRWHMFFSDTEQITPSAVRRLISNVGQEMIWELINLRICDRIGTGRPKEEPYRLRKFKAMIEEVMRDPVSVAMLKINGNDLINKLGIKSGPKIGMILNSLLEEVLNDPNINTYEYLSKKASELNNLPEKDLLAIYKNALNKKNSIEKQEIDSIRAKNYVK
jgi:tRNA nucleotidyltransferase (CCA-adding enzyme)